MAAGVDKKQQKLLKAIMAIQKDASLTEDEKAKKRQDLLAGKWSSKEENGARMGTGVEYM
jgi:predicted lysophospholipase L1 biosynthesis ABC-type transport system permease subunit